MQTQSHESLTGSKMTSIQQQRYDYLFPVYGKLAYDIVINIFGKGRNSWPSFLEKMSQVEESKANVKQYYKALYDTFELYEVYTPGQVIGNVNIARKEMGLISHTEKIKRQSEYDFNLVFVVEDHYESLVEDGVEKKKFIGYKPVAKVLPE
jgi:hypothetical protein